MSLSVSRRSGRIEQAEIRAMSIECEKLGGVNLAQGLCDTPIAAFLQDAGKAGIAHGFNSYTRYDGLAMLRNAIAQNAARFNVSADPETDIVVSAGSTGAFYCACLALLDPGDEVIVFEPYYGYHINTLVAAEAVPTYVRLSRPDWTFTGADLERVVTPRTKALVVNTPANPSGKVFSLSELHVVAEFAIRHNLFVITDEIYQYFVYDGYQHISPASISEIADRTITISGLSKTFSITGWRIGYSISSAKWAQRIGYMNDLIYVCAPAPLQYGVAVGLQGLDGEFIKQMICEYGQKRLALCKALAGIGLTPSIPQGSYYVLADISRLPGSTGKERAMFLLRETGVACVPGEAFYREGAGDNIARFCFAKTGDELTEACDRLRSLPLANVTDLTSAH